jgi:hypothetical protein
MQHISEIMLVLDWLVLHGSSMLINYIFSTLFFLFGWGYDYRNELV